MGGTFSTQQYRDTVIGFQRNYLGTENLADLNNFLLESDDFYNVFTTTSLDDFRRIKEEKPDNIVYIMSFVKQSIYLVKITIQAIKTMHDIATQN